MESLTEAQSASLALLVTEPGIVHYHATNGLTKAQMQGLRSINRRLTKASQIGDVDEWATLNRYFHIQIVNFMPCFEVRQFACSMINRLNRATNFNPTSMQLQTSAHEHEQILDFIDQGDAAKAAALARSHRADAIHVYT